LHDTRLPKSAFLHCKNKNSTIGLLKARQNAGHAMRVNIHENKHFLPKIFSIYHNNYLESKDISCLHKDPITQPIRKLNINTYFAKINCKTTSRLAIIKSKG
jgi:hypothetical protein